MAPASTQLVQASRNESPNDTFLQMVPFICCHPWQHSEIFAAAVDYLVERAKGSTRHYIEGSSECKKLEESLEL